MRIEVIGVGTGGVSVDGGLEIGDEAGGVGGRGDSSVSEVVDSGEEEDELLHASSGS